MKIFIDSANLRDIRALSETGLIDGVTTNPSLIAQSGQDIQGVLKEICAIVPGPVSAEVIATEYTSMLEEAEVLRKIAPNIVIKVPLTVDGLKACRTLGQRGAMVNVTLCFSPPQAILAAKAGATFISPFLGRLDDIGQHGLTLMQDIRKIYDNYPDLNTQILAASIRHPGHVVACAKLGIDVMTIPPKIFRQLYDHPLTQQGLKSFLEDWRKTAQSIISPLPTSS